MEVAAIIYVVPLHSIIYIQTLRKRDGHYMERSPSCGAQEESRNYGTAGGRRRLKANTENMHRGFPQV